jgi:hypothetical protein
MTSQIINFPSVAKTCAHVKHLGYEISKRIRLYGEEFEVVSDPFPEAGGIAVHVTTKKNSSIRVLRLPVTVLQSARRAETPQVPSRVGSAGVEQGEKVPMDKSRDQDWGKGAMEQNPQNQGKAGSTSMQGQSGRDEDAESKNADSDLSG